MKLDHTLVVLDLETTGIWVEKDKIVEIALIKIDPSGNKETYHKRANPGMPIPENVSQLINIWDKDVVDKPPFKAIAQEVLDFIGDSDLAGFNLERFDLPLLEREMYEAGLKFDWQKATVYDSQKIYHLNEKRDLTAAYKFYCEKDLQNAHSALADTEATLEILESQVKKYGDGNHDLKGLKQFGYKNLNNFYDSGRKFRWWNGALYPMFGKYAKRYSLQDMAKRDPKYMEWILRSDFGDEVKELVEDALKGQFPVYEAPSDASAG